MVLLGSEVLDLLDWYPGGRRCCLSPAGVVSFQNYPNTQVKDNLFKKKKADSAGVGQDRNFTKGYRKIVGMIEKLIVLIS